MSNEAFWKKYRAWMIAGAIVLVTGIGLAAYAVRTKEDDFSGPYRENARGGGTSGGGFCRSKDYPLRYGGCHPDVVVLQRGLKRLGADLGAYGPNKDGIDGMFGAMTRKAALKLAGRESFSREDIARVRELLNGGAPS